MIQKAIDILRLRKSDAILVIVIMVLCYTSQSMITPLLSSLSLSPKAFLVAELITKPISFLLIIVPTIFTLGFCRLAVFCPESPHKLCEYFSVGYKYFWRMLGFGFLLVIICSILAIPLTIVLRMFLDLEFRLIYFTSGTYCVLLFVKYLYFVPAQIVVYNRSVFESVSKIKHFRGKEINLFIGLCLVVKTIPMIIPSAASYFMAHGTVFYIIATICQITVETSVQFLLMFIAVLYAHRQFLSEEVP